MTEHIGVLVLGTGRSGTSVASRLINLLGVPTSTAEDLLSDPSADNLRGYWESSALREINEAVLRQLGGSSRAMPVLEEGWERKPNFDALGRRARVAHKCAFPSSQWVWNDPRNCTTLPFWRYVLDTSFVGVVISRNPLEVVASLERGGATKHYGLALWEQRTRHLLRHVEGMPVFFTAYGSLLQDPVVWAAKVGAFLASHGLAVTEPASMEVTAFVEPSLRDATFTEEDFARDTDVSQPQLDLQQIVLRLEGPHHRDPRVELPDTTQWADLLMAEYRSGYLRDLEEARDWLETQTKSWRKQAEEAARYAEELRRRGPVKSAIDAVRDRLRGHRF